MALGVRTPATTSSPWAFIRNSPKSFRSPVAGFRVKATPVPAGRRPMLPKTMDWTLTAVPHSRGDIVHAAVDKWHGGCPSCGRLALMAPMSCSFGSCGKGSPILAWYSALNFSASSWKSSAVSSVFSSTPAGLLHLVDELLKILFADLHDDVRVHLDKPAVGVVSEAGLLRLFGKGFDDLVVEAQVQDGVHDAGHGRPGAGADGAASRGL